MNDKGLSLESTGDVGVPEIGNAAAHTPGHDMRAARAARPDAAVTVKVTGTGTCHQLVGQPVDKAARLLGYVIAARPRDMDGAHVYGPPACGGGGVRSRNDTEGLSAIAPAPLNEPVQYEDAPQLRAAHHAEQPAGAGPGFAQWRNSGKERKWV